MRAPSRRNLSVLAAASLGAGMLLSAGPAQADVYSNAALTPNANYYRSDANCTATATTTGQTAVPLSANAGPASNTATMQAKIQNKNDSADTLTADLADTTTADLTSSATDLTAIHLASTGTVVTSKLPSTTDCNVQDAVGHVVEFDFTVTTPGYLDYTFAVNGPGYGDFQIDAKDGQETFVDVEGQYTTTKSSHSAYLRAGAYHGSYESLGYVRNNSPALDGGKYAVKLDASFTADGTPPSTPPATPVTAPTTPTAPAARGVLATPSVGKGLGYTSLPLARSCSTNTLVENVTSSKAAAKSIKKVTIFVDGAKALTVKRPKAGQALTVPVADNGTVRSVKTVVTTKKKGTKKTKKYSSSASYQDC